MEYGSYLKNMINSKDYLNSEYLISFAFGFRFTRIMEDGSCYKYLGKNYITLGSQTILFWVNKNWALIEGVLFEIVVKRALIEGAL